MIISLLTRMVQAATSFRSSALLGVVAVLSTIGCAERFVISSVPSGAKIFIDGTDAGVTPKQLVQGRQEVRPVHYQVEYQNHESKSGVVEPQFAKGRVIGGIFTAGVLLLFKSPYSMPDETMVVLPAIPQQKPERVFKEGDPKKDPMFRGLVFGTRVVDQIPACGDRIPERPCWKGGASDGRAVEFFDNVVGFDTALATEDQTGLNSVSFEFPASAFADLEAAFSIKYGKADAIQDGAWQSKLGAYFKKYVRTWKWRGLYISIWAPSADVDHGAGIVATNEKLMQDAINRVKVIKRAAQDL